MTETFEIELAGRMSAVAESATLKMSAAAKALVAQGIKVINFAAGEPDFDVPSSVKKAAIRAIEEGFSKYTPVPGIPELRKKICEKFKKDNGLEYAPEQVLVSSGAKQSLFNFFMATINPGDEVIIPTPYWVSYPEMVKIVGGTPVILKTTVEKGFKFSVEDLKKCITPKTRVLVLNSPSNPAGVVFSKKEMEAIAHILEGTSILVLSDEIYEKLIFSGQFHSFASVSKDAFSRTVTVNGFSKAYAMTGWRLGYVAGPKSIINAMAILQGQSTSGASSIVQKAGLEALSITDQDLKPMVDQFKKRRDTMAEIFSGCKHLSFFLPEGAFYLFLNVEKVLGTLYNHDQVIATCDDLALLLLNHFHVSTVGGAAFGHEEYLRLSFAVSDADVVEGSKKIVEAINRLKL